MVVFPELRRIRSSDEQYNRIPETVEVRRLVRVRTDEVAERYQQEHSTAQLINRDFLEKESKKILLELNQSQEYAAWTMVVLGSAFWKRQIEAIPYSRRILLLPHCMRNSQLCPAQYDPLGLKCQKCGNCELFELQNLAESLGYQVLIAEGTPVVMQSILGGKADAILGVGCLKSLERAFEKLQLVGIPAVAVPLLDAKCIDSTADVDWIREMIEIPSVNHETAENAAKTEHDGKSSDSSAEIASETGSGPLRSRTVTLSPSWLHLLRGAANLFNQDELNRLIPWLHKPEAPGTNTVPQTNGNELLHFTERIGIDFLVRGGKFFRPFITLATYDALKGSHGTGENGPAYVAAFPDVVKCIALAIEVFHKASLVHDDIEDNDIFRYGRVTIHNEYGIPTAINVGDYLIGLGYQLIASQLNAPELGSCGGRVVADILLKLGQAHTKLSEGQGAELFWRLNADKNTTGTINPKDSLKIYSLKTAPAFEAAIFAGLRLGVGCSEDDLRFIDKVSEPISQFARFLGIAFQIKNDLDDWTPEEWNKRELATDIFAGRPTVLWALANENLPEDDREKLLEYTNIFRKERTKDEDVRQVTDLVQAGVLRDVHDLLEKANVFETARRLIEKYFDRAQEAANRIEHEPLRNLLLNLFRPLVCVQAVEAEQSPQA
ncbi:MAG: polyprenyl synthetase family protein [Thermoguttaceae bacterium]